MTTPDPTGDRALLLTPTGRDGPLIARVLAAAGVAAEVCPDAPDLCRRWADGAGTAVVAEEALTTASLACLEAALARQPVWSDLPLLLLTGGGKTTRFTATVAAALQARGNVTLLERPLRTLTLVSAVRAALRARRRQYEVRGLLDDTRRAVRERDQFLAMLGHELRNPLAAIRAAAEVMNRTPADDRGVVAEQRAIITRQSANVTRLVDDLLDVARVTSGKIVLDRRPVDLREVARRSLEAVALSDGRRARRVTVEAEAGPLVVDGDAVRLEQVVTNLLTNALKYTPDGGRVWLRYGRDGDEAVVRVRDTGVGIAADLLPRLFDPFVQSEQSLARSAGGLGVGLTVVRRLVDMHGGTVEATSDGPGWGSEFVVRLPLAPASAAAAITVSAEPADGPAATNGDARGQAVPPARVGRTVLLVEDNDDARAAMQRLLRVCGHRVEVAADGETGVRRAAEVRPDVAIVDVGLPGIDGYEVARQTRATLGGGVYLIALTGYGQPDDRRRAEEAGFDQHLVKPVEMDVLERVLADGPQDRR